MFDLLKESKTLPISPLAARLVPSDWPEFFGQDHLVGPGALLRRAVDAGRLGSAIFFGPPGTGKTALSRMISQKSNMETEEVNAVTAGVSELRKAIARALERRKAIGRETILLVEEIHHFNRSQQDALLPDVEKGNITMIGLTTENPYFYINKALISRSTVYEFFPLSEENLLKILNLVIQKLSVEMGKVVIQLEPGVKEHLMRASGGDARRLLNSLELAVLTSPPSQDRQSIRVTLETAEQSVARRAVRYDRTSDDHYDTISAFIKSVRGSDPDAAVYWLAKMLLAGEDPRFLARRLVILASEDIGNADPRGIVIAYACAQGVEYVGMPEAKLLLSQATIYLACAPKSNASYKAIKAAEKEVQQGPPREVPLHLRDAHLDQDSRGHGKGYQYPHDFPGHFISQIYMPNPKTFYEPTELGEEKRIKERLNYWKEKRKKIFPTP